jgi:hypothetical protein
MGVLLRELAALYAAFVAGGTRRWRAPVQYATSRLAAGVAPGRALERQVAFWRERLDGAPAVLELPTDVPARRCRAPAAPCTSFTHPLRDGGARA